MAELVDLGGVWAYLHDELRPGLTNSGVVADDDGLTVIDGQLTPAMGAAVVAALEPMGLPVRRLALTSSHMPFVGGSGAFTLAAVYGTAQVSLHLDQPPDLEACARLYPDDAAGLGAIEELPSRRVTHTVSEPAWLSPSVVVAPVSGELDENLIVQVPEAQVVFAGAMAAFGVVPMVGLGSPIAWADALDQMLEWGEIFVPGHGPVGGREEVETLQAYLRACAAAEGDLTALPDGPWRDWPGAAFHEVNVERAAIVAAGQDDPPSSLLALLGLG